MVSTSYSLRQLHSSRDNPNGGIRFHPLTGQPDRAEHASGAALGVPAPKASPKAPSKAPPTGTYGNFVNSIYIIQPLDSTTRRYDRFPSVSEVVLPSSDNEL